MARNHLHEIVVKQIYDALLQLMDEKAYSEISISDIVQRAEVSRMAYYRNYDNKGEILTKHLEEFLQSYKDRLRDMKQLTEKEIWTDFFSTLQKDPIQRYLRMARLMEPTIEIFTDFAVYVYRNLFGWDMSDPKNWMTIYQRMGMFAGLMMFMVDYHQEVNVSLLAEQITSITAVDSLSKRSNTL